MQVAVLGFTLALLSTIQNVRSGNEDLDVASLLIDSSDESPDSSDSQEGQDLAAYHKYLEKQELKYYKEKFRKEISEEEKEEVKYFDDLLSNIKILNKKLQI